ncbi:hypothetical protein WG219_10045 [Ectopseudomonas mendocina]|uniref:Tail fiber protein n=1 Tax=Ectopseudomonas mendocina TaxID=300 RepID=A0ABZ2RNC7_ECTME
MTQRYINNYASALVGDVSVGDALLVVASSAGLPVLAAGDHFLLTLIKQDGNGNETAWEVVKVTSWNGTTLTISRAQEGTKARLWLDGSLIEARLTAGGMDGKQDLIALSTAGQFYAGDKTWRDLSSAVLAVILSGLQTGANSPISATDGLLAGIAKLQAQISARAPLASASLTGTPTAPTPALGTNTNQIATMAAVQAAIAALVSSSPAALDTLKELAAALGNDPNFATTMVNALAGKLGISANAVSASKLVAARTISLVGDVIGSISTDLSGNVSMATSMNDSGWLTPTLVNSFTLSGMAEPLRFRRFGGRGTLMGQFKRVDAPTFGLQAMTLPAGYRPDKYVPIICTVYSDNLQWKLGDLALSTDGRLTIGLLGVPASANASWAFCASYEVAS